MSSFYMLIILGFKVRIQIIKVHNAEKSKKIKGENSFICPCGGAHKGLKKNRKT